MVRKIRGVLLIVQGALLTVLGSILLGLSRWLVWFVKSGFGRSLPAGCAWIIVNVPVFLLLLWLVPSEYKKQAVWWMIGAVVGGNAIEKLREHASKGRQKEHRRFFSIIIYAIDCLYAVAVYAFVVLLTREFSSLRTILFSALGIAAHQVVAGRSRAYTAKIGSGRDRPDRTTVVQVEE